MDNHTTNNEDATEEWRTIPGYAGYYEVSISGQVRSLPRTVETKAGYSKTMPGKTLNHNINEAGYHAVHLSKDAKVRAFFVHRLVLMAFVGLPDDGLVGCHSDDDKDNNHLSNLRWDTPSENNLDMVRNGNHHHAVKTHCSRGHEYTPENTYVARVNTSRNCRTCKKEYMDAYRVKKREERAKMR